MSQIECLPIHNSILASIQLMDIFCGINSLWKRDEYQGVRSNRIDHGSGGFTRGGQIVTKLHSNEPLHTQFFSTKWKILGIWEVDWGWGLLFRLNWIDVMGLWGWEIAMDLFLCHLFTSMCIFNLPHQLKLYPFYLFNPIKPIDKLYFPFHFLFSSFSHYVSISSLRSVLSPLHSFLFYSINLLQLFLLLLLLFAFFFFWKIKMKWKKKKNIEKKYKIK